MVRKSSTAALSDSLVVLDTHVWIWLMTGSKALESAACLQTIEEAVQHGGIRISVISVWEVGMLEAKGRIRLTIDCLEWVNRALSAPGTSLVPLTAGIAIDSSRLPGTFHGDPADRMIVATARRLEASLITHDQRILEYGKQGYIRTLAV